MKWKFSSWNLFLFSLSKVCRKFSADYFIVDSQPCRAHYFAKQSMVYYTYGISGTPYTIKQDSRKNLHGKDFLGKGATAQKPAPPKGGAEKRAWCYAVGYTLLISLSFAPHLLPKFFSALRTEKHSWKIFQLVYDFIFYAFFILFYSPFLFLRVHERQIISLSYMDISKPFVGVFHKNFTKKIAENFSRQPHIKRKSDIIQTSFSFFIKLFFIVLKALLRSLPFFCRLTTVSLRPLL